MALLDEICSPQWSMFRRKVQQAKITPAAWQHIYLHRELYKWAGLADFSFIIYKKETCYTRGDHRMSVSATGNDVSHTLPSTPRKGGGLSSFMKS